MRAVAASACCALAALDVPASLAEEDAGLPADIGALLQDIAKERLSADMIAAILGSTEWFWQMQIAANRGADGALDGYGAPKLWIVDRDYDTRCGRSGRFRSLFYCSVENRIYFRDETVTGLSSFDEEVADFAVAFIVAHEVAHSIQYALYGAGPLGLSRASSAGAVELSRAFELQADCLAGTWAHYVENLGLLDPGDVEEAMALAERVGDDAGPAGSAGDRHGTAAERAEQFATGLRGGRPADCDRFPVLTEAAGGPSLSRAFRIVPDLMPLRGPR